VSRAVRWGLRRVSAVYISYTQERSNIAAKEECQSRNEINDTQAGPLARVKREPARNAHNVTLPTYDGN